MSRDIRSFFSITPKTKEKKSEADTSDARKRNRKRIILDSDSDEEPASKITKNEKESGNSSKNKFKEEQTSKYFEVSKETVSSMLGKVPIKRKVQTNQADNNKLKTNSIEVDKQTAAFFSADNDWFLEKNSSVDELSETKQVAESSNNALTKTTGKNFSPSKIKKKSEASSSPKQKKQKVFHQKQNEVSGSSTALSNTESKSGTKKDVYSIKRSPNKVPTEESKVKTKENEKCILSPSSKNHAANYVGKETNKRLLSPSSDCQQKILDVEKCQLWVEKYKPTSIKQIIGQQGPKSNVNKLLSWLKDWYKNHSGDKKLTKPSPWAKDDNGAYFKAALLSGSPGLGKTTTAHLVCKELEMDIVEFNASDTRSKKLLGEEVSELLSSKSLSKFAYGGGEVSKRHVLVMDEVDGMAGNEDRGGVQELINLLKKSKIPIICMCNDRNHPKIRSLANYCFDLRFSKPKVDQIKGAMMSICFKEKIKIKPETLTDIINSTNQDIRLILNHLSMLAAKSNDNLAVISKHVKLGPWDVLKKVFSESDHKGMTIHDKCDLFFYDYSVAPLFVHENYLIVSPHAQAASSKIGKMSLFAKAASSLCTGDLMESAIRSNNAWSLLPVQAVFSSLIPGEVLEGHLGGQINFPAWFGKNSRKNKLDRLSQELQAHTRLRISGSKEAITLDYVKPLRDHILRPLIQDGSEGVPAALNVLHNYDLLREDLEALTELNTWPSIKDPMASIDSKVKAAFTRAYNKAPVMTPFSISSVTVKKGRGTANAETWGDEVEFEEEVDEEGTDDVKEDAMILIKKKSDKTSEKKTDKKSEKKTNKKPDKKESSKPRASKKNKK